MCCKSKTVGMYTSNPVRLTATDLLSLIIRATQTQKHECFLDCIKRSNMYVREKWQGSFCSCRACITPVPYFLSSFILPGVIQQRITLKCSLGLLSGRKYASTSCLIILIRFFLLFPKAFCIAVGLEEHA